MSFVQAVPDIAKQKPPSGLPIDLVGIRDVDMPVRLDSKIQASAKLSISVSLMDKKLRGIHMSRLYLAAHDYFSKNTASLSGLKKVLIKAVQEQHEQSQSGRIRLESHWPVLRKALKSSYKGWREYPFYLQVDYFGKEKKLQYTAGGEVLYSSTCPCSASLSRKIIKKDFEKKFKGKSRSLNRKQVMDYLSGPEFFSAAPHAQKSSAFFNLELSEKSKNSFSLVKIINEMEEALGTPVQTAVKREDEAEFARLNASNLMFCEDAVRKLGRLFNKKDVLDYSVRVRHYESLHPFTVESSIVKGVKEGWKA